MAGRLATPLSRQEVKGGKARPMQSPKDAAQAAVTQLAKQRWNSVIKPLVDDVNKQLQKGADLEVESKNVDAEVRYLQAQVDRNKQHENELKVIEADLRAFVDAQSGPEPDPDDLIDALDTTSQQVATRNL